MSTTRGPGERGRLDVVSRFWVGVGASLIVAVIATATDRSHATSGAVVKVDGAALAPFVARENKEPDLVCGDFTKPAASHLARCHANSPYCPPRVRAAFALAGPAVRSRSGGSPETVGDVEVSRGHCQARRLGAHRAGPHRQRRGCPGRRGGSACRNRRRSAGHWDGLPAGRAGREGPPKPSHLRADHGGS